MDTNWTFVNNSVTRWCRLKLENQGSTCCELFDFEMGRGEGCSKCEVDCQHKKMIELCSNYFGRACRVKRYPLGRNLGGGGIELIETFCVPGACDKQANRDALTLFYATNYGPNNLNYLTHWLDFLEGGELECDTNTLMIVLVTAAVVIFLVGTVPICIYVFKAPKERGRVLLTQEEMQLNQEDDDNNLRGAGQGDDTYGAPVTDMPQ